MAYTLSGSGQTYTSATAPVYDPIFRMWRCQDTSGNVFNVQDMLKDAFAVSAGVVVVYPILSVIQFYLTFTPAERMLIKALAGDGIPVGSTLVSPPPTTAIPQDAEIAEFWAAWELAVQTASMIDLNLASNQRGLAYLSAPTAPTPIVLAAGREAQILQGIPQ